MKTLTDLQENKINELTRVFENKLTLVWIFDDTENGDGRFQRGVPFYVKEYSENVKYFVNKGGYISDDRQDQYWKKADEFYTRIKRIIDYKEKYSTISVEEFKKLQGNKVEIIYSDYDNGGIKINGTVKDIVSVDDSHLEVIFENGKCDGRDIESWRFYYLSDEFGVMAGDDSNEIDIYIEK